MREWVVSVLVRVWQSYATLHISVGDKFWRHLKWSEYIHLVSVIIEGPSQLLPRYHHHNHSPLQTHYFFGIHYFINLLPSFVLFLMIINSYT